MVNLGLGEGKVDKEYLKKLMSIAETRLLMTMFDTVDNYDEVTTKVNKLNFIDPQCQKIFHVMDTMYSKLGYNSLDPFTIGGYCDRISLPKEERESIMSIYTAIYSYNQGKVKLDFNGVFEEYSMVASVYGFHNWINGNGGIDDVATKLLKLDNMEQVNKVIEGRLLEFFTTGTADSGIKDTNLTDLISDDFLESVMQNEKQIETVPLMPQFHILNKITKGFVRGVTGFGGHAGTGKTSAMYSMYILSILENTKSKVCIYANEQTAKVFAVGMAFAFISNVVNKRKDEFKMKEPLFISRDKFISGNLSETELRDFVNIFKLFRLRYKDRITHSYFEEMTPNCIRRDVKKKFREGHKYFFYDTFKSPDEEYKNIMMLSSVVDNLTKKLPIHFYLSLQLADESIGTKYLTNKCLASAKGIKRVLECLLLMRKIDKSEIPSLKVHKLGHPEQEIALDRNEDKYYAIFINKNRNGADDMVLLYKITLDLLVYTEIGVIANIPKDDVKYIKKK